MEIWERCFHSRRMRVRVSLQGLAIHYCLSYRRPPPYSAELAGSDISTYFIEYILIIGLTCTRA
eukprot:scaffold295545_cov15-Prasinocladus_malaysianus.AAC.1